MLLVLPALIAALTAALAALYLKPGFPVLRWRVAWVLLFLAGCLGGILMAWTQGDALDQYRLRRSWPRVEARVLSSTVLGKRAFHPEIVYEYTFDGQTIRDTTDMDVPGFGTKANRLNVAERTVVENSVGSTLIVIVNPDNPWESRVHSWPRFSVYILYVVGVLVAGGFAFGAVGLVLVKSPAVGGEDTGS